MHGDPARVVAGRRGSGAADEGELAGLSVLSRKQKMSMSGLLGGMNSQSHRLVSGGEEPLPTYLPMTPDLVAPHISGIQIFFLRIEDHAMNGRRFVKRGILDVLDQRASLIDVEDVQEAGMFVERVGVDRMRRLSGCEQEDGAGARVAVIGEGWQKEMIDQIKNQVLQNHR